MYEEKISALYKPNLCVSNCFISGPKTCAPDTFACPNSTICLSRSKLCDSKTDCPGGEDESYACIYHPCNTNNGGCSHNCTNSPEGMKRDNVGMGALVSIRAISRVKSLYWAKLFLAEPPLSSICIWSKNSIVKSEAKDGANWRSYKTLISGLSAVQFSLYVVQIHDKVM